jgi:CheY-like chemotaxis protein
MTSDSYRAVRAKPRKRARIFQDLMRKRIRHILLVSSLYDSFILTEDGHVSEALMRQFNDFNLSENPDLLRVSSGEEAIAMAREEGRIDMIITSIQLGDMNAAALARSVKEAGLNIPVVLLAYNNRELSEFLNRHGRSGLDRIFLWQGDVRILLAMVKDQEDRLNVERDTGHLGVPAMLVVEDNIRYCSSFLPVIYSELMKHSQRLISEGLNLSQKILRMRARPKLLLCENYEEAWEYFEKYETNIMGILTDFEFPKGGTLDRCAGAELVKAVAARRPDIPVVMQSSIPANENIARDLCASFLLKGSPLLMRDLRDLLLKRFGFGDFVFTMPDGRVIDSAGNLMTLVEKLRTVPSESLAFHGERNHFSMWLKARSEFTLAERLRPRKVSDFESLEAMRSDLVHAIGSYREARDRAVVADFDPRRYDPSVSMARIGSGSLGGKARGLAFVNRLLLEADVASRFPEICVNVPSSVVLGTGIFDRFLEENNLADFALSSTSEEEIRRKFKQSSFPDDAREDLRAFLATADYPLAVRSSGLLEDSPSQPFAGVYHTVMIPNVGPPEQRLDDLVTAVRSVYASTFSRQAKAFMRMTPFRVEEEKMAVIVQRMVGTRHKDRFYPSFSGVARSRNVYPASPMTPEDGIAAVALGLGRTVVDGGACLNFCPRYPKKVLAYSSVDAMLSTTQREFFALDLSARARSAGSQEGAELTSLGLDVAESDGTLGVVGSTYSPENQTIYDGISRPGVRVVSFAPVLKHGLFPLAELLEVLLDIGRRGTANDVEIEFAVNLAVPEGSPPEFAFLQMRPLALVGGDDSLELGEVPDADLICRSSTVLGHGRMDDIRDLVVVDYETFDRMRTQEVADDLAGINAALQKENVPYALIGVGRWGSMDRHLGIPVTWDQISGARAVVESGFKDLWVTPSQGTHFFQNLTSLNVGYFTVNPHAGDGYVDWAWLAAQKAVEDTGLVRHLRFAKPISIGMNGKTGTGFILKPDI